MRVCTNHKNYFLLFRAIILLFCLETSPQSYAQSEYQDLFLKNEFSQVVDYFESQPDYYESSKNSELYYLMQSYYKTKQYDKFFKCYDIMEKKYKEGDVYIVDLPSFKMKAYEQIPFVRAEAYLDLGKYEKAVDDLKILKEHFAQGELSNAGRFVPGEELLVVAYALSGQIDKAKNLLEKVKTDIEYDRAKWDSQGATRVETDHHSAKTIAQMYMAVRDYENVYKSLDWLFQSSYKEASIFDEKEGFDVYDTPILFLRSKAAFEIGKLDIALAGYSKLRNIKKIQNTPGIYQTVLFDLGRMSEIKGNMQEAIKLYSDSIEIIEQQRSTITSDASKIGFVGDKMAVYNKIVFALLRENRYGDAFLYAERGKSRALVDLLASKKNFGSQKTKENDLLANLHDLEMKVSAQSENDKLESDGNLRGIIIQKKKAIRQTNPETASLVSVTSLELKEITDLIPENETVIEYFGSEETLFAFAITKTGVWGTIINGEDLRNRIRVFRQHIVNKSESTMSEGKSLYRSLIYPVENKILGKKITIVPHASLHYLPFCALCDEEGFLVSKYEIRVLPSASVMKFLIKRGGKYSGQLLAFGNPDLGDQQYDLPGAQKEAVAITKNTKNSKLLIRKKATETSAKKYSNRFRYLHFATHGTFDSEKPLASGLLLTSDEENDGTLTVGELYDLNMPADLVTLSACETALGKVSNGDDVVGFTRGFLYAGASSIVSSLWKVDDQATSILMQEFYKSLKGKDKRRALQSAQLKVKKTYNSHPFYWAAFQITGSVR